MKQHILAIDDELDMLKLLERIITEKTPYRITTTNNSLEVKQLLEETQFDLIITDLKMPGMDGMETTRRLRQHHLPEKAGIRVIALTASITEAEINNYYSAGIDAVIGKPLQYTELQRLLNQRPSELNVTKDSVSDDKVGKTLDTHLVKQHCSMLGREKFILLIDKLEQQCRQLTGKMQQAYNDHDLKAMQNIAHQLAGAAANFGLQSLSARCSLLETESETINQNTCNELKSQLNTGLKALRQFSQHRDDADQP